MNDAQRAAAEYLLERHLKTAALADGQAPEFGNVAYRQDGSIVITYLCYLGNGVPVPRRHQVDLSGRYRDLHDKEFKKRFEASGGGKFARAWRGEYAALSAWSDADGWMAAPGSR